MRAHTHAHTHMQPTQAFLVLEDGVFRLRVRPEGEDGEEKDEGVDGGRGREGELIIRFEDISSSFVTAYAYRVEKKNDNKKYQNSQTKTVYIPHLTTLFGITQLVHAVSPCDGTRHSGEAITLHH